MKAVPRLLVLALATGVHAWDAAHGQPGRPPSALPIDPGAISLEGLLPKAVILKTHQEAPIYYHATLDRAIGSVAPGAAMTLVGMTDTAYRVRGRARHGDVVGWMLPSDLISPDPNLRTNMKNLYERHAQVQALIDAHQVALGMTMEEVEASMGKPTRRSSKLTATGREDKLEYAVFERVPQVSTGRDAFGRPFRSVVYIKVETGTLSITFKDDVAELIEEAKGNPLRGAAVKVVPGPLFVR